MFTYKNFYLHLGHLFYAVAYTDGKIASQEKEAIHALVQYNWKHFEGSLDEFGQDAANIILYQFELDQDADVPVGEAFEAFKAFYELHHSFFDEYMKDKIVSSAKAIADSCRHINDSELRFLRNLQDLMTHPHLLQPSAQPLKHK